MRGERSSFPIRDTKREQASTGSSAVKTWKMSPEELEDYRARNVYTAPTNSNGKTEKLGMDLRSKPKIVGTDFEQKAGEAVGHIRVGPDKEFVLKRIADGKSILAVERELGMKMNGLQYWIRKWEWVGITPGKARAILSGEPLEEVIGLTKAINDTLAGATIKIEELENQLLELDLEKAVNLQQIKQLTADRDLIEAERNQALQAFNELNEEYLRSIDSIEVLENEKLLLLQTIEATASNVTTDSAFVETVNHPDHYTVGGIEVIDFIVAKLTDEEFAGFCKGNILKYASRANHKDGLEDIRKVKWYVDRLLDEVVTVDS